MARGIPPRCQKRRFHDTHHEFSRALGSSIAALKVFHRLNLPHVRERSITALTCACGCVYYWSKTVNSQSVCTIRRLESHRHRFTWGHRLQRHHNVTQTPSYRVKEPPVLPQSPLSVYKTSRTPASTFHNNFISRYHFSTIKLPTYPTYHQYEDHYLLHCSPDRCGHS